MNRNHVARNYFFTYFSIDFLSTFPIFIISCKADYIFYFSEALTLLKMFRIGTFLKYVKRLAQVSIYLYLICFKILSRVQFGDSVYSNCQGGLQTKFKKKSHTDIQTDFVQSK